MTDKPLSKLRLEFNRGASEVNRRPQLAGEYRHADEGAEAIKAAFWAGVAESGQPIARGKIMFGSVSETLAAQDAAKKNPPELPRGVDLKVGEAVIWQDPKGKGKNGEPHWYGYAHEGAQIVRIDAYERGSVLLGGVRPYRPKPQAADANGDEPEVA